MEVEVGIGVVEVMKCRFGRGGFFGGGGFKL